MSTKPSLAPGDALPPITRAITQDRVDLYADAAHDHNPIHLDAAFAAGTQFGRRIAHGMLTLAILQEVMAKAFPQTWATTGRLKARFKTPVYTEDIVTVSGTLTTVAETPSGRVGEFALTLRRSDGQEAITATAWCRVG